MNNIYKIDFSDFADKFCPNLLRDMNFIESDGDFAYADSIDQDISLILNSGKCNFYQFPKIGASISRKLNSSINKVDLKALIIENLSEDGIKYKSLDIYTIRDIDNIDDQYLRAKLKQDKAIISINEPYR